MVYYFYVLAIISTLLIHNINAHSFQVKNNSVSSQTNLLCSLQNEFKNPLYCKEVLPYNFSHLTDLLAFGNNTQQSPAYLRSVIKTFSHLLKQTHYINAYAFSDFLEKLSPLTQPYFALPVSRSYINNTALYDAHMFDRFKCTVNSLLYTKFSSDYESFKQDPGKFLENLSSDILSLAQEEVMREQSRQDLIRFLDIALSKLIWCPTEQEKTWDITKKITVQLAELVEKNILEDANDLDYLYWTILTRFGYFIEISTTDLTPTFFQTLKNDLLSRETILFELEEQDNLVESKKSYMQRTLFESEAQARGWQHGLIRG